MTVRNVLRILAASSAALLIGAGDANAQYVDELTGASLTGVLKRIKEGRVVRIGYRDAAIPFSFASHGQAAGYSIDLCRAIVDDIAAAIGVESLRIEFRPVTPADRIDQVVDGRIDLECGATTNTAERRKRVAFSPLIFVAGTRLLVKRGSPVRSLRDLAGRTVVVVRGTTNEEVMRHYAADSTRRLTLLVADDYAQALGQIGTGAAQALAADDVLLAGYLAEQGLRRNYAIVGDLLSYEPYGIMFARDDAALAEVVNTTFARLATSREIRSIYNTWFVRPLPSGVRLGLPLSGRLERSFEILGLPPE